MALVEFIIPFYSKEQILEGLFRSVKEANKFGITSILDAGTESINAKPSNQRPYDGLDVYQDATEHRKISLRVNASQYVSPKTWRNELKKLKNEDLKILKVR